MSNPLISHTLSIFNRTHQDLPPLVPEEIVSELENTLAEVQNNQEISLPELEELMAWWGKRIWPFSQAFAEYTDKFTEDLGHKLLLQKVGRNLADKCEVFFCTGGSFQDMYCGAVGDYFSEEERSELAPVLLELKNELRQLTKQAVLSRYREEYLDKVEKLHQVLNDLEARLGELAEWRENIVDEEERLKDDVASFIEAVNHGFARLGPSIPHTEVHNALDNFIQRKLERKIYS